MKAPGRIALLRAGHFGRALARRTVSRPTAYGGVVVRFPPGHYYSPLPDTRELAAEPERSRVWPDRPRDTAAIDWRGDAQIALCREVFARQARLEAPDRPTPNDREYHAENPMFPALDGWVLEGMLQHLRPARLIEIGCGYSSLVTARVNRELLDDVLVAAFPGLSRPGHVARSGSSLWIRRAVE